MLSDSDMRQFFLILFELCICHLVFAPCACTSKCTKLYLAARWIESWIAVVSFSSYVFESAQYFNFKRPKRRCQQAEKTVICVFKLWLWRARGDSLSKQIMHYAQMHNDSALKMTRPVSCLEDWKSYGNILLDNDILNKKHSRWAYSFLSGSH